MIFKYTGFNKEGKKVNGSIDAETIEQCYQKLKQNNILIDKLIPVNNEKSNINDIFVNKNIKYYDLSNLSRELSMYIKSGITIVNAIRIVRTHYYDNKKMDMFLSSISDSLESGNKLYSSLSRQNVYKLPDFYLQSIRVSEDNGVMADVLFELSAFLKEHDRINKEIKSSMAYPAFMIFVSMLMVSTMLTFVVPKITNMFINMKQELPLITQIVVGIGKFLNDNIWYITFSLIISITTFFYMYKKNDNIKLKCDELLIKIPLIGKIILKNEIARFSYITSLLVNSGVPIVHAINLSSKVFNNFYLKTLFEKASASVVEGSKLSSSLKKVGFISDNSFLQALSIGEDTSQLSNVLTNISRLYFEENKDAIKVLLSLLEPLLMLFVGITIGFIVIAMLLPIFSMSIS